MSTESRPADAHPAYEPTWLAPTPIDRERVVEMIGRLVPATRYMAIAYVMTVAATLATTVHHRGWAFLPLVTAVLTNVVLESWVRRSSCPEYVDAGQGLIILCSVALAAAMTGGTRSPLLLLIPLGAVIGAARSTPLAAGIVMSVSLVVLGVSEAVLEGVRDETELLRLAAFFAVTVSMMAVGRAFTDAESESRKASALDALTGLLNRAGLAHRFEELREQAVETDASICLVLFDLDHFKAVNDEHGHQVGDTVLRGVAQRVRAAVRRFELLYRFGGEEFLLVLPGVEEADGVRHAERLRQVIAEERVAGLRMTASFGVSAARGAAVDFAELYRRADRALYAAKSRGRDQVCGASPAALVGA